jgi:hypothetical protein
LVTRQVVAYWPSHMAGQPCSSASTDRQLGISLYRLLDSVTAKLTHERLLDGSAGHPLGPLVSGCNILYYGNHN